VKGFARHVFFRRKMADILDTYKPFGLSVTAVSLTWMMADSWALPSMVDIAMSVMLGVSFAAVWHFFVTLFLSSFPLLPSANWETPPSPPEPLESVQEPQGEPQRVDNQPVRQEARTGQPVTLAGQLVQPKRESMPMGVVKLIKAFDKGEITEPFSLNKLDKAGISRSQPRPVSDAHEALNWLRGRGLIDNENFLIGRLPQLNELPHRIDLSE
jgi:hypothetical protein